MPTCAAGIQCIALATCNRYYRPDHAQAVDLCSQSVPGVDSGRILILYVDNTSELYILMAGTTQDGCMMEADGGPATAQQAGNGGGPGDNRNDECQPSPVVLAAETMNVDNTPSNRTLASLGLISEARGDAPCQQPYKERDT